MYVEIAASRGMTGKPISQFDAMIVAMARSRGANLATRNVKDFEDCGVDVMDGIDRVVSSEKRIASAGATCQRYCQRSATLPYGVFQPA
jgi:hypothetical protein